MQMHYKTVYYFTVHHQNIVYGNSTQYNAMKPEESYKNNEH